MTKRIYAEPHRDVYAVVDDEDYEHFRRWHWCKFRSKKGAIYLRRARYVRSYVDDNGQRKCVYITLYLHREILRRLPKKPNGKRRPVAAHLNGNSLDCRRENLDWHSTKKNSVMWGGIAAFSQCVPCEEIPLDDIPF